MSGTWFKLSSVNTSDTLTEGKHKVVTPVTAVHLIVFQIREVTASKLFHCALILVKN